MEDKNNEHCFSGLAASFYRKDKTMKQYLDVLKQIIETGVDRGGRNGLHPCTVRNADAL